MEAIGYYPGCSLSGTAAEYDHSLRLVAQKMGIELREVPGWVCCGATAAHATDAHAALCLAADTLIKARRAGMEQILAPCAMCYQRLAAAGKELRDHPAKRKRVLSALAAADVDVARVQTLSLLQWLGGVPDERIRAAVTRPLNGLRVACYYGCLLIRPAKLTGEKDVERPRCMERILKLLGAEPVRWTMAMECCGGSFAISRKGVVLRQGARIVESARKAGADIICVACPMCHANLDMRQREFGVGPHDTQPPVPPPVPIPELYLTQLIGLAMGFSKEEMEVDGHFVPAGSALDAAQARASVAATKTATNN